jgi:hypothetical protein
MSCPPDSRVGLHYQPRYSLLGAALPDMDGYVIVSLGLAPGPFGKLGEMGVS